MFLFIHSVIKLEFTYPNGEKGAVIDEGMGIIKTLEKLYEEQKISTFQITIIENKL